MSQDGRQGIRTGRIQIDLVHEFMARVLVTYVDTISTVVAGVEHASVDLDDSEVQGVLARFCGETDERGPDELTKDRVFLLPPLRGNLMVQGLKCLQPLLQLLRHYMALPCWGCP